MGFLGGASGSIGSVGAATARLLVVVTGNTTQLESSLAKASSSLAGFQSTSGQLGSALTRTLTIPLLGLGVVSVALATKFEAALAKITALTPFMDTFGGTVDELKSKLFAMSEETATSVTALADTLYFAGSAGLTAGQALEVTALSAKGAAIGMGDATDIARTLIAAMNTFGPETLSAAQAMDVLTIAIREGLAEPAEFAVALGRLLAPAKQAGLTFDELVASTAQLTNLGIPTKVATTSLRALFTQLDAATNQSRDSFEKYGLTAQQVSDSLEAGPITTFEMLNRAIGPDGSSALRDMIPQIRGYTAFLALAGEDTEDFRQILEKTKDSGGAFAEAWSKFQDTPQLKFQRMIVGLQNAGIALGTKLLPIFLAITDVIQDVAEGFSRAGDAAQTLTAGALILGVALGPVLKLYSAITAAGAGMFTNLKSTAIGLTLMAAAAGIAVGALGNLAAGEITMGTVTTAAIAGFVAVRLAIGALQAAANAGAMGVNALSLAFVGLGAAQLAGIAAGITLVAVAIALIIAKNHELEREMNAFADGLKGAAAAGQTVGQFVQQLAKDNEELAASFAKAAKAAQLMGAPVSVALPELPKAMAPQAAATGGQTVASLEAQGYHELSGELASYLPLIQRAVDTNQDMGAVLAANGKSSAEFFELLSQAEGALSSGAGSGLASMATTSAEAFEEQVQAIGHVQQAYRQYQAEQQATMTLATAEQDAQQALADKYNVTVPQIQDALQRYGQTALGVMGEGEEAWAQQALGLNQATGEMVGDLNALKAAFQDVQGSVLSSIGLFGELPEAIKTSSKALVKQAEAHATYATKTAGAMKTLMEKGVPIDLIKQIAERDGPAMLQKLGDMAPRELKRVVDAYRIQLGLVDAEIVKEGKHEEMKGTGLVDSLVKGIMENPALTGKAATHIVTALQKGLQSGKITKTGMQAAQMIARGLQASGLPQKAIDRMTAQMYKQLIKGDFNKAGEKQILDYVKGILSKSGLPPAKVKPIIAKVEAAMKSGGSGASSAGSSLMQQFANGIQAGASFVSSAISQAIAAAKNQLDQDLKNSPKYFTYYRGEELMKQMGEGMEKGRQDLMRRPPIRIDEGARAMASMAAAGRNGQRFRGKIKITNWETGMAEIDGRMVDNIGDHDRHRSRMERMHQ